MKPLLLFISLLFSVPCIGQCPSAQSTGAPDTEGAFAVADNPIFDLPGWERLTPIIRPHAGRMRNEQWIYDGTRDESLYFENGHIA